MGPISVAKVYLFFIITNHGTVDARLTVHDARGKEKEKPWVVRREPFALKMPF